MQATNPTRNPIPGRERSGARIPKPAKKALIRPPVVALFTIVRPSASELAT